jgi:hypothetical protein
MRVRPPAQSPTEPVARGRPVVLVGLVGAALDVKLALQPLRRQQQPPAARATDGIGVAPAMLLELALALPQPALPSLRARHDPLRVELQRHLPGRLRLGLRLLAQLAVLVLAPELSPRLAKELAAALWRALSWMTARRTSR